MVTIPRPASLRIFSRRKYCASLGCQQWPLSRRPTIDYTAIRLVSRWTDASCREWRKRYLALECINWRGQKDRARTYGKRLCTGLVKRWHTAGIGKPGWHLEGLGL